MVAGSNPATGAIFKPRKPQAFGVSVSEPALRVWTEKRDRTFGNGRYVRNLFEKAVENHAMRISEIESPTVEQLTTLTLHDIGISLKNPDASDED